MAFRRSVSKPCRCLLLVAVCFVATSCLAWAPSATSLRGLQSCVPRRVRPEHQKNQRSQRARREPQIRGQDRELLAKQKLLTTQISRCKSVDEVLQVVRGSDVPFSQQNCINLCTSIHQIGKLRKTVKEPLSASNLFGQIVERIPQELAVGSNLQPRDVCDVLRALAWARDDIPELLSLLPAAIKALDKNMVDRMGCGDAINALWALATLNTYKPNVRLSLDLERVPDMLVERIISTMHTINIKGFGNTFWSIARLPDSIVSLREQLLPAILSSCHEYLARQDLQKSEPYTLSGIARIVWSLALLNHKDMIIIDQVSEIFLKTASNPGPGDTVAFIDVVCAHAKLQVVDEALLLATAGLPWKFSKLRDWDLCALAWSYQELDPTEKHKSFQSKLRKEVARRKLTQAQVVQSQHGYEEWYSER